MLNDALSRTLLLMRGDLDPSVSDDELIEALTSTVVVLEADSEALATHSGQSGVVTAALLMARSGHEVWLDIPDVELVGPQPPLRPGRLLAQLVELGGDLLPGRQFQLGRPAQQPDATFAFGKGSELSTAFLLATDWSAELGQTAASWAGGDWPIGAMAAAVLAAAEVFKISMRRLAAHARSPDYFGELYAPCASAGLELAPKLAAKPSQVPTFDVISGGAIANAIFFTLLRVPGLEGRGRLFDDDEGALSNLNRNMLLRRSSVGEPKVTDLASFSAQITVEPIQSRYEAGMPLAAAVLVGVDHIPSRWAVQAERPAWLGIGATESFSVLVSSHKAGQACAGCLHPHDAGQSSGPIPTAAFISFLSGLALTARWLAELGWAGEPATRQQLFLNTLRPESWSFGAMPVFARSDCPVGCAVSQNAAAAA